MCNLWPKKDGQKQWTQSIGEQKAKDTLSMDSSKIIFLVSSQTENKKIWEFSFHEILCKNVASTPKVRANFLVNAKKWGKKFRAGWIFLNALSQRVLREIWNLQSKNLFVERAVFLLTKRFLVVRNIFEVADHALKLWQPKLNVLTRWAENLVGEILQ